MMLGADNSQPSIFQSDLYHLSVLSTGELHLRSEATRKALVKLLQRVQELLPLWELMRREFPERMRRHIFFKELNEKIRTLYQSCAEDFRNKKVKDNDLLNKIIITNQQITALILPEINKEIAGEQPIHRLGKYKPTSLEIEHFKKTQQRLIAEGANPKNTTKSYKRGFFGAMRDILYLFPRLDKMIKALFKNLKKDAFAMSETPAILEEVLQSQQAEVNPRDPVKNPRTSLLMEKLRNALERFGSSSKPIFDKLNPSFAISELIGLHEELLGQIALQEVHDYLLGKDKEITGDFFRIIDNFKTSVAADKCEKTTKDIGAFFARLGIDNIGEIISNQDDSLDEEQLRNCLEIQILYYLVAYCYNHLNMDNKGNVRPKYSTDYERDVIRILQKLEAVDFSPAYDMHARLKSVDPEQTKVLAMKGALLGNMRCRYFLCANYFSHLMGNLNKANPPGYVFPENLTKELILKWAEVARDEGYTEGVANMLNFMDNFFKTAGAYYQEGVTLKQKERIQEIAEVVKAISGDVKVKEFVDQILTLPLDVKTINAAFLAKQKEACEYVTRTYGDQYRRTKQSIDKMLNASLLQQTFERHFVFVILTQIENEMVQEQTRLNQKKSPTADSYMYPLNRLRELKRFLVTEQRNLGSLETNDPKTIIDRVETLLEQLYINVKAQKGEKLNLKALKDTVNKLALRVLPKEILSKEVHRTKAIKTSYDLYQAARKINEGRAIDTPRSASRKRMEIPVLSSRTIAAN